MIRLTDLGKKFDGQFLFRNLNLEVGQGQSISLIGPSGSGKSVLFKIIARLILEDEGQVAIQSTNLGMLFQKNALFDSLTVLENLLFPLRERLGLEGKEAHQRARHFLNEVELSGTENQYPNELSGGMQKRLGIARALIVQPEVILYDEPTAGLDPITSRNIATMISKLQKQSASTLLTITNDIRRAMQLGQKTYLLANGSLSDGIASNQLQKSSDPAIRQFVLGLQQGPLTSEVV